MERLIGTDTASVVLFFNVLTSGIEILIIPWDQLFYPCIKEVSRLGLEPLCDTHPVSRVLLQIFIILIFVIISFVING